MSLVQFHFNIWFKWFENQRIFSTASQPLRRLCVVWFHCTQQGALSFFSAACLFVLGVIPLNPFNNQTAENPCQQNLLYLSHVQRQRVEQRLASGMTCCYFEYGLSFSILVSFSAVLVRWTADCWVRQVCKRVYSLYFEAFTHVHSMVTLCKLPELCWG